MENFLKCYIIDDEPLAQQLLQEYIGKVTFLKLTGIFDSPLDATAKLKEDQPDLIFLDINMPDIDGLSYLKILNPRPFVILVTAYDEYALEAFNLEVHDYLLKPIAFERFYKSVLRLYQTYCLTTNTTTESKFETENIYIKDGKLLKRIALKDICIIKGMKDFLQIYTTTEKILTYSNFEKMEQQLGSSNFIRVHRSFIVALDKIDYVENHRIKIGKEIIPISDSYKNEFYRRLGSY